MGKKAERNRNRRNWGIEAITIKSPMWNAFAEFIKKYGAKTQSEIAKLWGNISRQTIHRALKKIGFTRKKRLMDIKKETKKNELNF